MQSMLKRVFGVALLASLALANSASAGTILEFAQTANVDFVSGTFSGGTATLNTHGVSPGTTPTWIPIDISQLGNLPNVNVPAFEIFGTPQALGLTSTTPQSGTMQGGFSGAIVISSTPSFAGLNILTTVFSGGTFNASGGAGGLNDSQPTNTVTFTTAEPNIIAALGGATTATGNFSLAFTNIAPQQGVPFTSFTAENTGLFAANVIPEPASIVMASMGLLGVCSIGLLRRKSSRV